MLNEVDANLATATSVSDEQPDDEVSRHVQVTSVWTKFKEDLATRCSLTIKLDL